MKATVKYRVNIKSDVKMCCLCLSPLIGPSEPIFWNEQKLATCSELGKILLVVLSMNETISSRYCCPSCVDKVVACFEALLDLNAAALVACQMPDHGFDNQVSSIYCKACSAVVPSVRDFTKHLKQHALDISLDNCAPPASANTPRTLTQEQREETMQPLASAHSPPADQPMSFYDLCEVVDDRGNKSCVDSAQYIGEQLIDSSLSDELARESDWNQSDDDKLAETIIRNKGKNCKRSKGSAEIIGARLCHQCGKSYSSLKTLKCHLRSHDPKSKKTTPRKKRNDKGSSLCDKCGKSFMSSETLRLHRQKHETPCSVCGKGIYRKYMKSHLLRHNGKQPRRRASSAYAAPHPATLDRAPLNCAHCDKVFSDRNLLVNHMVVIHGEAYEKKRKRGRRRGVECSVCRLWLSSEPKLQSHKLSEHGVTSKDRFQCEVCERWYIGKVSLRKHIRLEHMDADPHSCKLCPKVFKRYTSLWAHTRATHQDLRPYQCGTCASRYRQRYEAVNHLGKHVRAGDVTLDKAFLRILQFTGKPQPDLIYLKDQKVKEVSQLTLLLMRAKH